MSNVVLSLVTLTDELTEAERKLLSVDVDFPDADPLWRALYRNVLRNRILLLKRWIQVDLELEEIPESSQIVFC